LIEVLLAFVVFALSFTVVLEILSGSMRNTVRAKEYTEVALIAQSIVDQVGLDVPLEAGYNTSGETGQYRWQLEINTFDGGNDNAHSIELGELSGIELLEVDFTISWGDYPRERSRRFSTVRAVLANRRRSGA
jgi:general secretion pathway protein I